MLQFVVHGCRGGIDGRSRSQNSPQGLQGQASAALVLDLKRRGLLDDTIVIWGREFCRTAYSQGAITKNDFGRDHHPKCFTLWVAGGGFKSGYVHGQTDDFGYNIVRDQVSVLDFHATMLQCLGINHKALTYRFEGRDYRLTDIHGELVKEIITLSPTRLRGS